jgi:hypothetical protein
LVGGRLMSMENIERSDDWRQVVRLAAQASYDNESVGILLSTVPSLLKKADIDVEAVVGGQQLLSFMLNNKDDTIQLLQNESSKGLWVVLPNSVTVKAPTSQYFPSRKLEANSNRPPRYNPIVWKAFVQELDPNLKRWIRLSPHVNFEDSAALEGNSETWEIEREFVRSNNLFMSNAAVAHNIQTWAAKHQIPISQITVSDHRESSRKSYDSESLLRFLGALKPDERPRVLIPADILARFLLGDADK